MDIYGCRHTLASCQYKVNVGQSKVKLGQNNFWLPGASLWVIKIGLISIVIKFMAMEIFWLPNMWWSKILNCQTYGVQNFSCQVCSNEMLLVIYGDWKHFVAIWIATEFFFDHHTFMDLGYPIDNGLFSIIDLAMKFDLATKFDLPCNKM